MTYNLMFVHILDLICIQKKTILFLALVPKSAKNNFKAAIIANKRKVCDKMSMTEYGKSFQLQERKLSVLAAIVNEFLKTGEPIGSKAVTNLLDMNVSSATVRNDMAALEKMGLIEQPHTSSGRIPSYLGYRVYIEKLMKPKPISEKEKNLIDQKLLLNRETASAVLENAADALATLTGCTAVTAASPTEFSVITHVEVVPAGHRIYALLMITSDGDVKNKICRVEFDISDNLLKFFIDFINENLTGISADELNPAFLQKLALALGSYMMTLSPLLSAVYELSSELKNKTIHLKGEANLLAYSDVDATEIVRFLSTKNSLASLLSNTFDGINVLFGKEKDSFLISNGSMIVSPYEIGHKVGGSIGIIGPIRLDYAKLIPYVEYFSDKVTGILSDMAENYQKGEDENGKGKE